MFSKMSFLIHLNFSPLASIIFIQFLMKLQFMDMFKITLTAFYHHGRVHDVFCHFYQEKLFLHILHKIIVHDVSSLSSSKTFVAFSACYSTWCFIIFFVKKCLSHFMHFKFMVGHIMSDEFLFVKKRSSHLLHVTAHDASSFSSSKKRLSHFMHLIS